MPRARRQGVGGPVGGICARVGGARSRRSTGGAGSTVLRSIGVDETGYKNGHKYMTVVVDHNRGRVVWACAEHGYLPKEGLRAVFRAGPGRAGGRARPPARLGVQVQDTGVRRALQEGQAQARRDPALHRARRLQRPRGGREQRDKGRDQAGLRLQERGRPDRPHHAQVLGPEAGAAGEDGFVIHTHTNSRSLVNIADLFHRPWRVSF